MVNTLVRWKFKLSRGKLLSRMFTLPDVVTSLDLIHRHVGGDSEQRPDKRNRRQHERHSNRESRAHFPRLTATSWNRKGSDLGVLLVEGCQGERGSGGAHDVRGVRLVDGGESPQESSGCHCFGMCENSVHEQ